jgi:sulfoquinovosidase
MKLLLARRYGAAAGAGAITVGLAVMAACGQERSPRLHYHVGDFAVTIRESPPEIRLRTGDQELAIIDGRRFAFRSGTAGYEARFGSFKIEETAGDWLEGDRLRLSEPADSGAELRFDLLDERGAMLASGIIAEPDRGHVSVTVTSQVSEHNRSRMSLDCASTEHFNGLGAQAFDVDHRGQNVPLFVSEPGIGKSESDQYGALWFVEGRRHANPFPVPAVISSRGSAWLVDTYAYANFDLCKERGDRITIEAWEGELRFHLFAGPTPLQALSRMTEFVGRPALPPPWAFAPWNDAIKGPEVVRELAAFLRANRIPSSAIWTEDFRGGFDVSYGYRLAPNWRADRDLYPDLPEMIDELRQQGFATQLYFNPHVIDGADVADEARSGGYLVRDQAGEPLLSLGADGTFGGTGFLDLTQPAARAWAKGLLREAIDLGSLGWMADFGEWMPVDGAVIDRGDPELVHNQYPMLWQKLNREAMDEAGVAEQMCVYFRSGHLRSQTHATIVWAGDQRTNFQADDGLPSIIPIGLGLAATGFPFYAHDIGGYQFLNNEPDEPRTKEVFFRWTELGALTPVMRTHHGIRADQNWHLASDAETVEHWRRYTSLHVQLYPYFRALARRAVAEGIPLWIPMGLLHPNDEPSWSVTDQFYLGDALLVAPVITDGAREREVYLPAGRFAPLFGGQALVGPAVVSVAAPLTEIPVFVRSGGLVPMTREPAMTLLPGVDGVPGLESTHGDRILYVGLGNAGEFTEEDGASYRLDGTGTDLRGLELDRDGAIEVTGNATIASRGFTLTLSGHPDDRRTRVVFR